MLVVLPNIKLLSTAVPNTLKVYRRGRQQTLKPGMPRSHKEWIVVHSLPGLLQDSFGQCSTIELQNNGPAPDWEKHLGMRQPAAKFSPHLDLGARPLMKKGSHGACELTKLPLFTEQLFICMILS